MTKKKLTGIIKYKVKEYCVYQNISPKSARENIYGKNNSKSVLVILSVDVDHYFMLKLKI